MCLALGYADQFARLLHGDGQLLHVGMGLLEAMHTRRRIETELGGGQLSNCPTIPQHPPHEKAEISEQNFPRTASHNNGFQEGNLQPTPPNNILRLILMNLPEEHSTEDQHLKLEATTDFDFRLLLSSTMLQQLRNR